MVGAGLPRRADGWFRYDRAGGRGIAITRVDVAADLVLIGLWVLLSLDLGVRYLVLRRTT